MTKKARNSSDFYFKIWFIW